MIEKLKDKDLEPFTLICLFIRTLSVDAREQYHVFSDEYDHMRFDSKALNALSDQELIEWNIEKMEVALTDKGLELARVLVTEIDERS